MIIYFQEEELEFIDWSLSLDDQEIMVNVTDTSGEKKEYKYSECKIEPIRVRSETLIYEKNKNQYNTINKGIEIGDKYVLVEYCESGKKYLMKKERVEFLETLESSNNIILKYFKNVAQERVENAKNDKKIKESVVSQFERVPFIEGTVMDAYVNKLLAVRRKSGELIYPFGINESQMLAVKEAFSSQISVIEGPPGTGKTQTILNIIANVVIRGKTCAIVSNNNDAVKNVYEKLEKYDLEFLVAKFGRVKNRETFFDEIKMKRKKNVGTSVSLDDISNILNNIEELLIIKNQLAKIVDEIREIEIEQRYLTEWIDSNPDLQVNYIEKYNLSLEKNVSLLAYMKYIAGKKLNLIDRWNLLVQFKIINTKLVKQISDRENFIFSLQHTFYKKLLMQKTEEKNNLEKQLESVDFDNKLNELQEKSLQFLYGYINENRPEMAEKQFDMKNYKQNFESFVRWFPIIGSSTYSLINSIPRGYVFDYVIIDEASQQDLIPGVLCFGCAKNLVVVGDARQLPHIASESNYSLEECYKYYNCQKYSLLDSISNVLGNHVRKTLLKEHYRCHPKIIQFCNKHFYENQLIPMTEDRGENALTLIITALGNHMRNYANQREIESVMKHQEMAGHLSRDEVNKDECVGFIAPYNNQVDKATELLPSDIVKSTIHKFQGRECDKIIFSTVLDKKQISKRNLDFVDDAALVNVAVSRAKKEFVLVTGNDVFKENNKHIAALMRYIEYYAEEKEICNSPVVSAFDLLYKEYDKSLEKLSPKLRAKDSNFKSEQIAAALLREVFEQEKFKLLTFHREIYLKQLVKIEDDIFSENEIKYINNRARCDFVIYYAVGKKPFAVIEVDGSDHDKPVQQERDAMKNSILHKAGIPICRLKTIDSEIKEKMIVFLEKCLGES